MKKRKNLLLLVILLFGIAWMIFAFSAQNGEKSADLSEIFTEKFLNIFHIRDVSFAQAERFLRKSAHFIEFFILGAVLCLLLTRFWRFGILTGVISFGAAFLYAVVDECHQYFIPGRSASFKDILLDGAGAFCGVLFVFLIYGAIRVWRKRKRFY